MVVLLVNLNGPELGKNAVKQYYRGLIFLDPDKKPILYSREHLTTTLKYGPAWVKLPNLDLAFGGHVLYRQYGRKYFCESTYESQ